MGCIQWIQEYTHLEQILLFLSRKIMIEDEWVTKHEFLSVQRLAFASSFTQMQSLALCTEGQKASLELSHF